MSKHFDEFSHGKSSKRHSFLETRAFAQGIKAAVPVLFVQGAVEGPTAVVMACQHGRELNGIAAIKEVYDWLKPEELKGTVIFLPILNPVAVRTRRQDYPGEEARYRQNAGCSFDLGKTWLQRGAKDTYNAEITTAVWDTFLQYADAALDLHGWTSRQFFAWARRDHQKLLQEFGTPCFLLRSEEASSVLNNALPTITFEMPPQNLVEPQAVALGRKGILNFLKSLHILGGELDLPPQQYVFEEDRQETTMETPVEGLLVPDWQVGELIPQGQTAARVLSLDTLETIWEFAAPHDALLFHIGAGIGEDSPPSSLVYPGQNIGMLMQPSRIITR